MIRLRSLAVVAVVALAGCSVAPTPAQLATADYGPRPDDPKAIFSDWAQDNLYDPHSVQDLEISLERGYWTPGMADGGGPTVFGWMLHASFNAKNRMGGYAGRQTVHILERDGHVVQAMTEQQLAVRKQYPW